MFSSDERLPCRNYRVGGDIQPKRDLTRFVRWPKYVRLQRMKKIMLMRPPAAEALTSSYQAGC